jgi:hypothetical protein
MGKKLATGGFGTVYKADLLDGSPQNPRPVIVKKVPARRLGFRVGVFSGRLYKADLLDGSPRNPRPVIVEKVPARRLGFRVRYSGRPSGRWSRSQRSIRARRNTHIESQRVPAPLL